MNESPVTIYIVAKGEYSDYSIWGVFDSKEKAQAFIAYEEAQDRFLRDRLDIEEWTLNACSDPISKGLICFSVWFPDITKGDAEARPSTASDESEGSAQNYGQKTRNYGVVVWAKDEQAALKIANERRVQYLLRQEQSVEGNK